MVTCPLLHIAASPDSQARTLSSISDALGNRNLTESLLLVVVEVFYGPQPLLAE